jgi:Holliday junction resolvase RusA-like endonuclease
MSSITFTIPGKPFGKQRPRATRQGRMYTPAKTVSFERAVGQIAAERISQPFEGPVSVTIWATFEPAKSWSKKKTAAHLNRPHTQRPDLDNCAKAILDGINRIAFADDSQVAEIHVRKVWGPKAQTVVIVEQIGADVRPPENIEFRGQVS